VLITNYSNQTQNIIFNQIGGTGSTNCGLVTNNSSICAGNSATINANNSGGLTNPQYAINPGGSNPTSTFVVSPIVTTTYTISITGNNNLGILTTQTAVATVTVKPQPSLSPTFTQATCTNSNNAVNLGLSFNPVSPVPSYTVTWNPTPLSVTNATQTTATNLNSGTTTATVVAAGGCSASTTFTMLNVTPPTFTLNNITNSFSITCVNPSINLAVVPSNLTYFWINSISSFTSNAQNVVLTAPAIYTVNAISPLTGCVVSQTFAIGLNTIVPTCTVSPLLQTVNCFTNATATFTNVIITPTVNVATYWYCPSSSFPSLPTFTQAGSASIFNSSSCGIGTYTAMCVNLVNGCTSKNTMLVSSILTYPSFTATSSSNFTLGCAPTNTTLLSMAGGNAVGGSIQYAFIPPTSTLTVPLPVSAFSPSGPSTTITAIPGIWTFVAIDVNSGCQTGLPVSILQNTLAPSVSASMLTQTLTCNSPTILATGTSSTANTNVTWLIPSLPPALNSPSVIIGTPTGPNTSTACNIPFYATYTAVATNTINSCKSTQTYTINQNFTPPGACGTTISTVSSPSNNIITCKDPFVNMNFTASNPSGLPTWYAPAPQSNISSASSYSAYIEGTYTLNVKSPVTGCIGTKTIQVKSDYDKPVLSTAPIFSVDCAPVVSLSQSTFAIALTNTISSWSILFKVYPPSPNFSNIALVTPPFGYPVPSGNIALSPTLSAEALGRYVYVVTNNVNGCSETGEFELVAGALHAGFTANTLSGYAPLNVNFTNNSSSSNTLTGTANITSVWSFGNGVAQTTTLNAGTSALYNTPGTYTVLLTATKGACIDTAYKVITVDIPSKIEIPNVFTPNGDGNNDVFFLRSSNLTEVSAIIFDRWGNKVYELTSTTGNIAWDGKNQEGKECAAGTFFYIIKAKGKDDSSYEKKGNVSLYR
jgi:gliding motility-associated-like protein